MDVRHACFGFEVIQFLRACQKQNSKETITFRLRVINFKIFSIDLQIILIFISLKLDVRNILFQNLVELI